MRVMRRGRGRGRTQPPGEVRYQAALQGPKRHAPPPATPSLCPRMQTKPAYGETLPALLQRRFGVPERRTLIGFGVLVVLLVVAVLVLRDPLGGRKQVVHEAKPVFNTLYREGLVTPAKPRP